MRGKTFTGVLLAVAAVALTGCAVEQEPPIVQEPIVLVPVVPHGVLPFPDPNASTLMSQTLTDLQIRRERVLVLYEESRRRAAEALAKDQYSQAKAEALNALELANDNPTLFSTAESNALRDAAKQLLDQIDYRWQQVRANQASAMVTGAKKAENSRVMSTKEIRREKVAALVADAKKLEEAAQFREAADLLRQAAVIDPQDVEAQLALRLVMDKIADRDYEAIRHRAGQDVMRQNSDSVEHLIPYPDTMIYPEDWAEITRRRSP